MKICIETYGCTANKSDESIARYQITNNPKYNLVEFIDDADLVIIFTCTVISATEQRMLSRIKQINKLGKKIIVAGCMASIQKDLIEQFQLLFHLNPHRIYY